MCSPIERKPNNDKTIMPLRGEGNQKPSTGIYFALNTARNSIVAAQKDMGLMFPVHQLVDHIKTLRVSIPLTTRVKGR